MFITRKYHETVVKQLSELSLAQQEILRQGYHGRISALEDHVEDLRKLAFPSNTSSEITKEAREADAVISVSEKPIDRPDSDLTPDDMRQFDMLMAGEHEEGMVE